MKQKFLAMIGLTALVAPLFLTSAQAAGSNSRETTTRCVLYYGCPPVATPPAPVPDASPVSGKPPTSGKP